jgi:Zn-dependent protease with chaperone function
MTMLAAEVACREVDFASLPSGFRERFVILFATGLLFASYFPSTTWYIAINSIEHPGSGAIMVPGAVLNLSSNIYSLPLFLLSVLLLYLIHPLSARRRFGPMKPLDPESPLGGLCQEAARTAKIRRVRFFVTGDIFQQDAITFGLPGIRRICLGGGMRIVAAKDANLARAVISHELAHIRNGDVDISVVSRAIVGAMIAVAFATVVITLLGYASFLSSPGARRAYTYLWSHFSNGTQSMWDVCVILFGWVKAYNFPLLFVLASFVFFVILTWLAYAAVLRSRELYADIRAADWTSPESVKALLAARSGIAAPNWVSGTARVFSFHPSGATRAHYVERPWFLLRLTFIESFLGGVVGGTFYCYLSTYTTSIRPNASASGWVIYQYPKMTTAQDFYAALTQNSFAMWGAVALLLSWVLWLAIIGSQQLRGSAAVALRVEPAWSLIRSAFVIVLIFFLGLVVGDRANPVVLWTAWNEWPVPGGILSLFAKNIRFVAPIFALTIVASYLAVPAFRIALRLNPRQPTGPILRALLVLGWVYFVLTAASGIVFLVTGGPSWFEPATAALVWSVAPVPLIAMALITKRLVRRGNTAKAF